MVSTGGEAVAPITSVVQSPAVGASRRPHATMIDPLLLPIHRPPACSPQFLPSPSRRTCTHKPWLLLLQSA